jgi:hypothetical protein
VAKFETDSESWWDDRLAAMESVLGRSDGMVTHAVVPFRFGYEAGGRADVVHFRKHIEGVVYATCELIGIDDQIPNSLGNYELAICHRSTEEWGVGVINSLAYYTLDAKIEPGQTMDIGAARPSGSIISALLFTDFGRFVVRGRDAGLLLCIGITPDELVACRNGYRDEVEAALASKGVYPFTDVQRWSVLA